jgi:hypothetical protein
MMQCVAMGAPSGVTSADDVSGRRKAGSTGERRIGAVAYLFIARHICYIQAIPAFMSLQLRLPIERLHLVPIEPLINDLLGKIRRLEFPSSGHACQTLVSHGAYGD